jgi:hypothetical protein
VHGRGNDCPFDRQPLSVSDIVKLMEEGESDAPA